MGTTNKIAQKRYSMEEAMKSVPCKDLGQLRKDIKKILEIKSRQQLTRIASGKSAPTLAKAKAVEEYFLSKWGIKGVWKEII